MALLLRINVFSKKSTSFIYTLVKSWLPFYPRRYVFTNTCSIYFAKKVDDLKIPKCPDFEQYFKKPKKDDIVKKPSKVDEEFMGKKDNEIRNLITTQPPIFDDSKSSMHSTQTIIDESNSTSQKPVEDQLRPNLESSFKNKAKPLTGQLKTLTNKLTNKLPTKSDKKGSSKSLADFSEFVSPFRPPPKSDTIAESLSKMDQNNSSYQNKEIETPIIDKPTNKQNNEPTETKRDDKNKKKNFIWLAAAGAALCGIGLALLLKKSSSDDASEGIVENPVKFDKTEDEQRSPLAVPTKVPYLIIGGGTASWSAFKAIIEKEPKAKVLVLSNESYPPYMRPSLSKELWCTANKKEIGQDIYYEPKHFYTNPMHLLNGINGGVSILYNRTAQYLRLVERKVVLDDGTEIEYDKCLLATGSKPRNLHIFRTAPIRIRNKISFFRNLEDFQSLKEIADESESIAVIGSGFVASEISSALTQYAANKKKLQVYQIFHEDGNMGTALPRYLSNWIKKRLTDHGLSVIPNTQVDSVDLQNSKLKLGLLNGKLVMVDHVIVALGTKPDVRFAKLSGLKVNSDSRRIVVNEKLEALSHLYVAGDAACLPGRLCNETEISYDHALASGRLAGENMTGQKKPFTHQSMFSSTVASDISFESVGVIDAALKTVGVFSNGPDLSTTIGNTRKGVIFYIEHDEVVGIVLWNIFNKINVARQVIAERKKLYDLNEVAKLFEIQE